MSRSKYTLLIDSLIKKKIRDNFRVYLERAHPAFLTTFIVLVYNQTLLRKISTKLWSQDVLTVRPHIGAFILRNVDLLGKNLKKVNSALNKTHGKLCNNRKSAVISLHDLNKVKTSKLIYKSAQGSHLLATNEE